MSTGKARNAANAYGKTEVQSGAAFASPHRLILMLMDGAIDKINTAKGFMERKSIAEKGSFISWAISIIGGLRDSLDFEKGGEIAANLEALYDYMARRLVIANVENDTKILDEVVSLLKTIREAWINISDNPGMNNTSADDSINEATKSIADRI